jgi:hypothetical protein
LTTIARALAVRDRIRERTGLLGSHETNGVLTDRLREGNDVLRFDGVRCHAQSVELAREEPL